MKITSTLIAALLFFQLFLLDTSSLFAQKNKNEHLELKIDSARDLINSSYIKAQDAPSMEERESNKKTRALPALIAGYVISQGVQEIQKMINNHKNKFIVQYPFASKPSYFYDQVSTKNSYDPTGIQFKGFSVVRIAENKDHGNDTVLTAKFILDTIGDNILEMLNNGVFRLRLDSIKLKGSKVKMPNESKGLNIDFDIEFTSSYRGDNGQVNSDLSIGKFVYTIRNAPVDAKDPNYQSYYDKLIKDKPPLNGVCFLVPRSVGYFKNQNTGNIEPCWGQGIYTIKVNVKETSKPKYIDKIIMLGSDPVLSIGAASLKSQFATPAAKPAAATTTPVNVKN